VSGGHEPSAALPDAGKVEVVAEVAPRRQLGLFDVVCIGVNATVGSGVFALPDDMHRAMGGYSPFAYLLCTLLLLPVALCFAELAGRFDRTGGAYVYAHAAFGPRVGFLLGWFCWTATFVSWAANATLLIDLIGPESRPLAKLLCAGLILALGGINYVGVKPGTWVVNLAVIGKVGAILCFLVVAFFAFRPGRLGGALPLGAAGVGQGVYLALFPLQGFEVVPVTAGETANPRRNMPLGTMGTLLFSALLFTIVQAALVATYPGLGKESRQPLVDGARYLGPGLGLLVFVGSVISIGGFTAGSALGSPRYAQAIAEDGMLPRRMAALHPRWATPYVAILVTTALSALLALFFDYRTLVQLANITVVVTYASACLAVPFVRKLAPTGPKGWVIPGGWLVPALGLMGSLVLLASASSFDFVFAGLTLGLGLLVARLSRTMT